MSIPVKNAGVFKYPFKHYYLQSPLFLARIQSNLFDAKEVQP